MGGTGIRGKRRLVLGAGAGVLLLGATLFVVIGRADDGPAEAWRAPSTGVRVHGEQDLGLWAQGSVVTRISPGSVTGYDAADGGVRWDLEEPEGTVGACAAGEHTNSEGIGAVFFTTTHDSHLRCTVLGIIDTRTGELLWRQDIDADGNGASSLEVSVTVSERTVTVSRSTAWDAEGFHRFDLATGEELPDLAPASECPYERLGVTGAHTDARIVLTTVCGTALDQNAEPYQELSVYDMDTGEVVWTRAVEEPDAVVQGILSADPLIVVAGADVVAYSGTGTPEWRVPRNGAAAEVAGGTLITQAPSGDDEPGVFTGYDLDT
jgi:outer membrane protein assembly factor BamB